MAAKSILVLLMMVASIASLVPSGLASREAPLETTYSPSPSVLPELSQKFLMQCWSSAVMSLQKCLWQLKLPVFSGQIGQDCCNTIMDVSDKCWPKLIPINPFSPSMLKNYCSLLKPVQSPPPAAA